MVVNQKKITRGELIFYLRKAGYKIRMGELLGIQSSKFTQKDQDKVLNFIKKEKQKGNNISYGEAVVELGLMTFEELVEFLNSNKIRLNEKEKNQQIKVNNKFKLNESEKKLLEEKSAEPEIIEIDMIPVHHDITKKADGKALFLGTDLPTFDDEVKKRKKIDKNKKFTLEEIEQNNKFTSNYYPKNYHG